MNVNYQDLAVKILRIVALIVVAAGTVAAAGIVLCALVALAIMLAVCLLALFLIKPSVVKELAEQMADRLDDWLDDLKDIAQGAYELIRETVNLAQCQSQRCDWAPKETEQAEKAEPAAAPQEEKCKTNVAPTALGATAAIAATATMAMEDDPTQASEPKAQDAVVDAQDAKSEVQEVEVVEVVDAVAVEQSPASEAVKQEPEKKE
ncbi:MAG: hypothetical protein J6S08_01745 [Duodenibacillus sp.]|nr:hypothetical protein [Duodenibacillus sp.]